jgi:hypothetical protein
MSNDMREKARIRCSGSCSWFNKKGILKFQENLKITLHVVDDMYHTCVTFQYKIYKNNKSIDLRIVNSTNVKISKTIQICYFLCSQDYNEFWIETLHDCGIHNYLQPDFFLNFLELRNSDFSFFKRAICSPSYNVSFRTPHSLKRTVLHFCLE